jgi:hypothetical protein
LEKSKVEANKPFVFECELCHLEETYVFPPLEIPETLECEECPGTSRRKND